MKNHRIFSVVSAVGFSVFPWLNGSVVNAQTSAVMMTSHPFSARVDFVPPAEDGAPTHSRGGATRDPECDALQVLPESGSGLTVKAHPTVQAYFQAGVRKVWMKVSADDGSEVYTYGEDEYFVLPEGKGFAEVPLPSSLNELTPNKRYSWEMVLLCNQPFGPSSPSVSGGIRRVDSTASLDDSLLVTRQEAISAYAEAGLWYDYIAVLSLMKAENPDSTQLVENWESALRAVNLDIIFDEFEVVE